MCLDKVENYCKLKSENLAEKYDAVQKIDTILFSSGVRGAVSILEV